MASKDGKEDGRRYTYVDVLERVSDGVQVRIVGAQHSARERGHAENESPPPKKGGQPRAKVDKRRRG